MGQKIFVSYKYADDNVQQFSYYGTTTVRDYVTKFEEGIDKWSTSIYKGESDDEDLSYLSENSIWSKLKDRIYDSTVTVVFISPGMKESWKPDKDQWIPWEIAFSLREQTRNDRTSHSNSLVCVVLPDRFGSYRYYEFGAMSQFEIIRKNIANGYAEVVKWSDFKGNYQYYINRANSRKSSTPSYQVVKTV